jgi:HTH-type transcriptional regulator/antitoxin HigA
MDIKIIKSKKQYQIYLERMNEIFDAQKGTSEFDELDLIMLVLEKYEAEKFPNEETIKNDLENIQDRLTIQIHNLTDNGDRTSLDDLKRELIDDNSTRTPEEGFVSEKEIMDTLKKIK